MLAIDVGNSNITAGIFEGSALKTIRRIPTHTCISDGSFLAHVPDVRGILPAEAVMVSVRRQADDIIVRELLASGGKPPLFVDVNTPMGIDVMYETKDTLGIDRLVCAAAAYHLYREMDRPVIVIDMGTATTIDYITGQGVFRGGMIAPGIWSAYGGLLTAAPQLPRLEDLDGGDLIGASTAACVRSGVVRGHAAMIARVVEMMADTMKTRPVMVITGGPAGMVRKELPESYIMDANLILKGLSRIHSLHNENKC
ncbi:MAG TPA: type III pantothenate kinase [Deltaproteobacteria bacterium]|nr:type III pantothenate kinase [Deltaproteobacteria bacterium]